MSILQTTTFCLDDHKYKFFDEIPDDFVSDSEDYHKGRAVAAFNSENFEKLYRILDGHKFHPESHGVCIFILKSYKVNVNHQNLLIELSVMLYFTKTCLTKYFYIPFGHM